MFELVFNTSMTGYQEILTDPSYRGQGVLFTASHIGNVGINPEDCESGAPQISAVVLRAISPVVSNWRASSSLPEYLASHGVPGISGVDTRWLTRKLRDGGTQKGSPFDLRDVPRKAARDGACLAWAGWARHGQGSHLCGGVCLAGRCRGRLGAAGSNRNAPADRGLRFRHQAQHFTPPGQLWRPGDRRPGGHTCQGSPGVAARWDLPLEWTRRSGRIALRGRNGGRADRQRRARPGDLPGSPIDRPRPGRRDPAAEVRASRRQPSCPAPGEWQGC